LFMLALFIAGQTTSSGFISEDQDTKQQNIPEQSANEPPWLVPGIKQPVHGRVVGNREDTVEGLRLQIWHIIPESNADEDHYPGSMKPLFTLPDSEKKHYIVNSINRYAVNGKPFCYVLSVSPIAYSNDGQIAGVLGHAIEFAYYDEEGQGNFKTRERVGLLPWHPRLPDWVKNASQKTTAPVPP
jgi:hypothetical protein